MVKIELFESIHGIRGKTFVFKHLQHTCMNWRIKVYMVRLWDLDHYLTYKYKG